MRSQITNRSQLSPRLFAKPIFSSRDGTTVYLSAHARVNCVSCEAAQSQSETFNEENKATHDQSLFTLLRQKRLEISKQLNVPPYVIFHDTTLIELATKKPNSLEKMRTITGIGDVKIKRYGADFLEVINTSHQ